VGLNRLAKNAKITANLKPKDRIAYLEELYERTRDTHRKKIISEDLELLNLLQEKSAGKPSRIKTTAPASAPAPATSDNSPSNNVISNNPGISLDDLRNVIFPISLPGVPIFKVLKILKSPPNRLAFSKPLIFTTPSYWIMPH
nr:hypothetical protein [Paenibacillus sp. ES5-4]